MTRAVAVTALLVATLAAGLGGCGDDRSGGPRGEPSAVVRAAPERTIAAGTARLWMASAATAAEGVVDLASGRSRLRVGSAEGPAAPVEVVVDFSRTWLAPPPPGEGGGGLTQPGLQPANPMALLDVLRGAADVEPYGGYGVRGASTMKYEVVADLERAAARAGEAGDARAEERRRALEAAVRAVGGRRVSVEVWVDSSGRVRRIQVRTPLRAEPATTTTAARSRPPQVTTIDLFDFGVAAAGLG